MNSPWIFNYVIMTLYAATSARHFWSGNYGQGCYWICALGITATVTFLPQRVP